MDLEQDVLAFCRKLRQDLNHAAIIGGYGWEMAQFWIETLVSSEHAWSFVGALLNLFWELQPCQEILSASIGDRTFRGLEMLEPGKSE